MLNHQDYSLKNALNGTLCSTHYSKVEEGSLGCFSVQYALYAAELLPVIGQIVSLIEWFVMNSYFACFSKVENTGPIIRHSHQDVDVVPGVDLSLSGVSELYDNEVENTGPIIRHSHQDVDVVPGVDLSLSGVSELDGNKVQEVIEQLEAAIMVFEDIFPHTVEYVDRKTLNFEDEFKNFLEEALEKAASENFRFGPQAAKGVTKDLVILGLVMMIRLNAGVSFESVVDKAVEIVNTFCKSKSIKEPFSAERGSEELKELVIASSAHEILQKLDVVDATSLLSYFIGQQIAIVDPLVKGMKSRDFSEERLKECILVLERTPNAQEVFPAVFKTLLDITKEKCEAYETLFKKQHTFPLENDAFSEDNKSAMTALNDFLIFIQKHTAKDREIGKEIQNLVSRLYGCLERLRKDQVVGLSEEEENDLLYKNFLIVFPLFIDFMEEMEENVPSLKDFAECFDNVFNKFYPSAGHLLRAKRGDLALQAYFMEGCMRVNSAAERFKQKALDGRSIDYRNRQAFQVNQAIDLRVQRTAALFGTKISTEVDMNMDSAGLAPLLIELGCDAEEVTNWLRVNLAVSTNEAYQVYLEGIIQEAPTNIIELISNGEISPETLYNAFLQWQGMTHRDDNLN